CGSLYSADGTPVAHPTPSRSRMRLTSLALLGALLAGSTAYATTTTVSVPTTTTTLPPTTFNDVCGPGKASQCTCTGTTAPCTCTVTAVIPIHSGSSIDFGACGLLVKGGKALDVGGGSMSIKAASLHLEGNAKLLADAPSNSGKAGGSI